MNVYVLDEREIWHGPLIEAAKRHGHIGKRIRRGEEAVGPGCGFIRPHAAPLALARNHVDFEVMAQRLTMIQDADQVSVYEDKSRQLAKWAKWMPPTWRFTTQAAAMAFIQSADYPLVSKADEGASSVNVRILADEAQAARHIAAIFGPGVSIDHCSGGSKGTIRSLQKGYVLLQQFIPHTVTWRVNAIGRARAIFKRYCYPDRSVAQTGNVEPCMALDAQTESLLEYADRFFLEAGTKWCALDILKDGDGWKLLETSLAWPWPSPGTCNEGQIFRSGKRWISMFDVMWDEFEAGAWA